MQFRLSNQCVVRRRASSRTKGCAEVEFIENYTERPQLIVMRFHFGVWRHKPWQIQIKFSIHESSKSIPILILVTRATLKSSNHIKCNIMLHSKVPLVLQNLQYHTVICYITWYRDYGPVPLFMSIDKRGRAKPRSSPPLATSYIHSNNELMDFANVNIVNRKILMILDPIEGKYSLWTVMDLTIKQG